MSISSINFILFVISTLVIFYSVKSNYRWAVLLFASIIFISFYSLNFLVFTLLFSLINFGGGVFLEKQLNKPKQKLIYNSLLFINIGVLCFYKYINFLIDNIYTVIGWVIHNKPSVPYINIIIPIGISFYTFQCIGYIININKKQEKAERHFGIFFLSILYFPKLVSGPVERSKLFLPQLHANISFNKDNIEAGLRQVLFGFFKKLVIADRLSPMINQVYHNLNEYHGLALLMVMFLQIIHIYCDFSGYTDIALGISKMFGLKLSPNFERPFLSPNVTTFWRRWHMSLSTWCNDYIFKQTMFNRRKWGNRAATYAAFLTFIVIGIWHGARWTFIILGILQAIAINYEFYSKRWRLTIASKFSPKLVFRFSMVVTFLFMSFSLIFFNAETTSDAWYFITHIFDMNIQTTKFSMGIDLDDFIIVAILFIGVFWVEIQQEKGNDLYKKFMSKPVSLRWAIYYIIIILILFSTGGSQDFVYQQF